jgi:hypothetical protein
LAAVAKLADYRDRQFKPERMSGKFKWAISLCPAFERHASDKDAIPSEACGVYRYKRGEEIVYIGRGQIRSRVGAPDREGWDFERIEYSLVADEANQLKWEHFWLRRFEEEHGKRPIYNRNSGQRPKG